jgi:DNA sulfur modification protein DndD
MILEKVSIQNFRQYKGEQTIDFTPSQEKNVTIVNGGNGAGKTNLFKAINWCLYGEIGDKEEIINKAALSEAADRIKKLDHGKAEVEGYLEPVEAKVTVRFSHDGHSYYYSRSRKARYVKKLVRKVENKEEIKFEYDAEEDQYFAEKTKTGETIKIENPIYTMNSILPSQMRTYFFFDGEKIDEFTKPGHEAKVIEGIRQVLQLDAIERAINHLERMARDYNDELKEAGETGIAELAKQWDKAKNELEELIEKSKDLRNERESAERVIAEMDKALGRLEKTRDLIEERERIDRRLEDLEETLRNIEEDMRYESTGAFLVLSKEITRNAESLIEKMRNRGEIPSGIREQFLKDLLDRRVCICKRKIKPNSPEERALKEQLQATVLGTVEDLLLQMPASLKEIAIAGDKILETLPNLLKAKAATVTEMERCERRKKEISEQVEETGAENIKVLERKRREHAEKKERIIEEQGKNKSDIEHKEKELDDLRKKIEREEVRDKKVITFKEKYHLSESAKSSLESVYSEFIQEKREEIKNESEKIFKSLIWKESQFQEVTISSDFELEVFDRWGTRARRELSAGERQCFSLAFIMAMANATKAKAPFVMDTPFARISEVPLKNIASKLPGLTSQLVLFVTDKEFPAKDRAYIKPKVNREYDLDFDDKTGCTTIKQVK